MNIYTFRKRLSFSLFTTRKASKNSDVLYINFGINRPTFYRLILNIFLGLVLILLFQNQENLLLHMIFFTIYSIDLLRLIAIDGYTASFILPSFISAAICRATTINFPNSIYIFWATDMIQLLSILLFMFLFIREKWIFDKRSGCLTVNWYNFYERKRETYSCELRRIVDFSIFESKVDVEGEPDTFWGVVIVIRVLTKSLCFNSIKSPNPLFYLCLLRPYIFLSIEEAKKIERKMCQFLSFY